MGTEACHTPSLRTAMDRDVFSKSIVFADFDTRLRLRIKVQILWVRADHRAPADAIAAGNGHLTADHHMASNFAVFRDRNGPLDDGEWPDAHALGDVGFWRNQGAGMDVWILQSGLSVAQICESKSRKIGNSQTGCILTLKILAD